MPDARNEVTSVAIRDECADLFGIVDHDTILAIAHTMMSAICVGTPTPAVKAMADWCTAHPQPGDLVVEMSGRGGADSVGLFQSGNVFDEVELLVQLEPRRTCRWKNASFIRLPKNAAQRKEAMGR
jgi:hypothetical protein